jgi:SAM-dependent methyltransferase
MKICLKCNQRFDLDNWSCPQCEKSPEWYNGFLSFAPELSETNNYFDLTHFAHLANLETNYFWFRARNQLIIWALKRHFPNAKNFFEIGCGTGFVLSGLRQKFPMLHLVGSEAFSEGLTFAQKRLPTVTFLQMDARWMPFECEFDVIGAFDVLEHIEEDQVVLEQMFQTAKPGGGIILTVPQHQFLWSVVDEYSFHKRRYSRRELMRKVKQVGFEVKLVTSFVTFLLPLMLTSRLKRDRTRDNFDLLAEYKIGSCLNQLLEKILGLERIFIKLGASLPLGGSLLMVAKRPELG